VINTDGPVRLADWQRMQRQAVALADLHDAHHSQVDQVPAASVTDKVVAEDVPQQEQEADKIRNMAPLGKPLPLDRKLAAQPGSDRPKGSGATVPPLLGVANRTRVDRIWKIVPKGDSQSEIPVRGLRQN